MEVLNDVAEHFREIRKHYSEYESSFTAADTRILISQIPGGMLSNLESQLKQQNALDKINDVMNEIPAVRKDLGYPPLVTPTSQIVGTQAVLNVLQGERYKTVTAETKALLGGHYGKTPAPVNKDVQKKALGDEEPITCRPADLITPEMEKLTKELGSTAKSVEDVLTYALFPKIALDFFKARERGEKPEIEKSAPAAAMPPQSSGQARAASYTVVVDGKAYSVVVSEGSGDISIIDEPRSHASAEGIAKEDGLTVVDAPLAGRVVKFLKSPGDSIAQSETVMVIEAMKMETEIKAPEAGKLDRYFVTENTDFAHGEPLYAIKK
jgi:oxaloacetate decarboxylase alpha subunit